jgi:hypothetical protein
MSLLLLANLLLLAYQLLLTFLLLKLVVDAADQCGSAVLVIFC